MSARQRELHGAHGTGHLRWRLTVLRITLPDERITVEGAIDIDRTETGIVARRVSSAYRHELPVEVEFLASSPSCVRLAFATDSRTVELEMMPTLIQIGDDPPRSSVVDLVVDGVLTATARTEEGHRLIIDPNEIGVFDFVPGEPATVRFDVPAGAARVEVWLPSSSVVEARAISIDDGAILSPPPADDRPRWVHHGSSISHCFEAHSPARTWPAVAASIGGVHVTNLGLAGQCQLDQFMARTIRDHPADLLSLKVGINIVNGDTLRLRTFPSALHGFLDTVRDGHPSIPMLVVSPIICPAAEDTPGPTIPDAAGVVQAHGTAVTAAQGALTLRQIRAIVADVVAARRAAGDEHLHHLDGLELFDVDDVADLPDGLHPNGDGYQRIGERFAALAFAPGAPLST
jgi:hypothetical protein